MHAGKSPTCHDQQLYLQISAGGVHLKAASHFNDAFFARRLSSPSIGRETILMPNLPRRSLRKNRPSCRRVPVIAFQKGGTLGSARVDGNGQGYFGGLQITSRCKATCVWLPSCERGDRNDSDRRPGGRSDVHLRLITENGGC